MKKEFILQMLTKTGEWVDIEWAQSEKDVLEAKERNVFTHGMFTYRAVEATTNYRVIE